MTNIFEKAKTSTQQGNIGEGRAIYEYLKLGYDVTRTTFNNNKYDLLVSDDFGKIIKVQVKTSRCHPRNQLVGWQVNLVTSGGNTKLNTMRAREDADYDELFVVTADDRCWRIPVASLNGRHNITVGCIGTGALYSDFELNPDPSRQIPNKVNTITIDQFTDDTLREVRIRIGNASGALRELGLSTHLTNIRKMNLLVSE
jgi:hypothetical protein